MQICKNFLTIFFIFSICLSPVFAIPKTTITDYQPTFIPVYDQSDNLNIAIRMYSADNETRFLCVDPYTLQTKILSTKQIKFRGTQGNSKYFSLRLLKNTHYMKLLQRFSKPPYLSQNYGATHASHNLNGMFLTIDMCPSTKPFEKRLFLALIAEADKLHRPIPIGISISGLWILQHKAEFMWLLQQQDKHKLAITWINHSFSHPYYQDLPPEKNFLLTNAKYFEQEVLAIEKLLLEHKQIPTIYFRFPGLISDKELVQKLTGLGLIAIGSDAWLAKNQQPKPGSFILIHGNGNEPMGIDKFLLLLRADNPNFLPLDQGLLNDLKRSIAQHT